MLLPIITAGITLIIILINVIFGIKIVNTPSTSEIHFGFITVGSVFAGFLYTNYTLLIDCFTKKIAEKLSETDILDKRNRHIRLGVIYTLISVVAGLLMIIDFSDELDKIALSHLPWITYSVFIVELISIIGSIILFTISMQEMNLLLKKLSDIKEEKKIPLAAVKATFQRLRNAQKQTNKETI